MDRWNIVSTLNYLSKEQEVRIITKKILTFTTEFKKELIPLMVELANLTRNGFSNGDISTLMSPRTIITWAENSVIFDDLAYAFKVTFLNKCDEAERAIIAEYYQRCFSIDLPRDWITFIDSGKESQNAPK